MMRSIAIIIVSVGIALSSCVKQSDPVAVDITYPNVHYGPDTMQTMDVYIPGKTSKTIVPVFILIHGGGWYSGDKSDYNVEQIFDTIIHAGYVVVNMNYRLVPQFQNPAPLDDIDSVITFLQHNRLKYGIDPTHICLVGRSSGSQLALMYAYTRNKDKYIKGVVDFFGPTDLTARQDMAVRLDTQITNFLGARYVDNKALWRENSPLFHINGAIPTVIFHGSTDDTIFPTHSQWLRDSLQNRGLPYYYRVWGGYGHSFDVWAWQTSMSLALNWLNPYMYYN